MRFLFNKVTLSVGVLLVLGTLGLGEFIFWRVLKVSCSNDKVIENMVERHPLKKILSSEEVAKMASFLISDDALSISGQIFNMDAGIVSFKS